METFPLLLAALALFVVVRVGRVALTSGDRRQALAGPTPPPAPAVAAATPGVIDLRPAAPRVTAIPAQRSAATRPTVPCATAPSAAAVRRAHAPVRVRAGV